MSCKEYIYMGLYFDEEDQSAGQTKPLIEGLVGHVAGRVLVQRLGEGKVGGREVEVEVVESVEAEEEEGEAVYSQAEAMVERVAAGQLSPSLQLVQDQLHLPSPLHLLQIRSELLSPSRRASLALLTGSLFLSFQTELKLLKSSAQTEFP